MTYADLPLQVIHVLLSEHIPNQAIALSEIQAITFTGDDAGSILTPMLKNDQCIVQILIDVGTSHHPHNSAHTILSSKSEFSNQNCSITSLE
jgi:hypothetical protein